MVKQVVLAGFLLGVMAFPAPLRGVQTTAGVPQDPSAVGYLNLHKRHPDASEGKDEFDKEYSSEKALERLTQMRGFLKSFSQLTEKVRGRLSESELKALGNTGRDMQTIGFHNIPLVVEGTILKQAYQLAQAQYQLAQLKRNRGDISSEELDRARTAYEKATRQFQMFWDTKLPTD